MCVCTCSLASATDPLNADQWGTLAYLAPEVPGSNAPPTPAADVWAFGVMLWQMAAGEVPYKGLTQGQILGGLLMGGLELAWPAGASTTLQRLARACMERDPAARPTFRQLSKELKRVCGKLDGLAVKVNQAAQQAALKQQRQQQEAKALGAAGVDGTWSAVTLKPPKSTAAPAAAASGMDTGR